MNGARKLVLAMFARRLNDAHRIHFRDLAPNRMGGGIMTRECVSLIPCLILLGMRMFASCFIIIFSRRSLGLLFPVPDIK